MSVAPWCSMWFCVNLCVGFCTGHLYSVYIILSLKISSIYILIPGMSRMTPICSPCPTMHRVVQPVHFFISACLVNYVKLAVVSVYVHVCLKRPKDVRWVTDRDWMQARVEHLRCCWLTYFSVMWTGSIVLELDIVALNKWNNDGSLHCESVWSTLRRWFMNMRAVCDCTIWLPKPSHRLQSSHILLHRHQYSVRQCRTGSTESGTRQIISRVSTAVENIRLDDVFCAIPYVDDVYL